MPLNSQTQMLARLISIEELGHMVIASFAYSWIPAAIVLWIFMSRKNKPKLCAPIAGFIYGAVFSHLAGDINDMLPRVSNINRESFEFYTLVGLTEESIKFAASYIGLITAYVFYRIKDRKSYAHKSFSLGELLSQNWLAQVLSGSLGFAAAENFTYGMDGQGSFARLIPMIAHMVFAALWGSGWYASTLVKSRLHSWFWLALGLFEGVLAHGVYNCLVSKDVLTPQMKVFGWLMVSLILAIAYIVHRTIIEWLEAKSTSDCLISDGKPTDSPDLESLNAVSSSNDTVVSTSVKPSAWEGLWDLLSLLLPGFKHIFKRNEILVGLSFLSLAAIGVYIVINVGIAILLPNTYAGLEKLNLSEASKALPVYGLLGFASIFYLAIGAWSCWEAAQTSSDLDRSDLKRRFTVFFPVSTLFLFSVAMSIFLPIFNHGKGAEGETLDPNAVIREIPMGLNWEIESIDKPQEEVAEDATPKDESNLSMAANQDSVQRSQPNTRDPNTASAPTKGLPSSENRDLADFPDEKPSIGYIGVQLTEKFIGENLRPVVTLVYSGTSAERAGLRVGDVITSVDGLSTAGMNAFEVSNIVRGPLGTHVYLGISRDGGAETQIKAFRTGAVFEDEKDEKTPN